MSNANPFLLPYDEQYDGSNWISFKAKIRAVAKQRGTLGYLDGTISRPIPPLVQPLVIPHPTTYWGALNPSVEEWDQRDSWTQGLITLNVKNAIGLGIKLDGTAHETYKSIADIKDKASDLGCITAENALNEIRYMEGTDMEEHIAKMRTGWTLANAQGADIKDEKFRMIVLRSLPAGWLPFVGSLYGEKTSAAVIERIIQHALFISSITKPNPTTVQALSTQGKGRNSHLICSNPNCGKTGHLIDRCFREGGGMAGQYPDWWRKGDAGSGGAGEATESNPTSANSGSQDQPRAIAASAAVSDPALYYAFSAALTGKSLSPDNTKFIESFADSAASSHFFRNRDDFTDYQDLPDAPAGETANGEFRVAGTGTVIKHVDFEGRLVEVRFEHAMHTPDLRHNLISIGCLIRRGYGVTFIGDRARFLDREGIPFMESEGMGDGTMFRLKFATPGEFAPAMTSDFTSQLHSQPKLNPEDWVDAAAIAIHHQNNQPHPRHPDTTPYKLHFGVKSKEPDVVVLIENPPDVQPSQVDGIAEMGEGGGMDTVAKEYHQFEVVAHGHNGGGMNEDRVVDASTTTGLEEPSNCFAHFKTDTSTTIGSEEPSNRFARFKTNAPDRMAFSIAQQIRESQHPTETVKRLKPRLEPHRREPQSDQTPYGTYNSIAHDEHISEDDICICTSDDQVLNSAND